MNEITKYKNAMNKVKFSYFDKVDSRIFFALCAKMKNRKDTEVTFTFDELRKISRYHNKSSHDDFADDLKKMYSNMIKMDITSETIGDLGKIITEKFMFFSAFRIDPNVRKATISVNPIFQYLVNGSWDEGKWTIFYIEDYVALKSEYSQAMFRLLKQWRVAQKDYGYKKAGHKWDIGEWRELLCIPDSYQMHHIDKFVLKHIHEELPKCFENLEIKKLKEGKGNRITHIELTFKPETQEYGDFPNADAPDARTKAEKIADIEAKEEAETATPGMTNLKNVMKNERKWMQKNGIPDGTATDGLPGQLRMAESDVDGVSDGVETNNPVPMPDEIRRKYGVGEKAVDGMKRLKDDESGEVNATFLTNLWERLFGKKG